MRKTIYTLLFLLSFAGLHAQQTEITGFKAAPTPELFNAVQKTAMTVDTIDDYLARATAFYTLTAGTAGYVLGSGTVSLETGLHYDGLGATTVTEVIAFFSNKTVMGGAADSLPVFFYASNPADTTPMGLPLGTGSVNVDDIDTTGGATFIPINSTGPANGDFIISLGYDALQYDDTVALFSSNPVTTGGGPDGAGERRTRQNTAGGWFAAADIWTIGGTAYDADAMLIPIVDYTAVGVEQSIGSGGLQMFPAYPNPSQVELRIPYELDAAMAVKLSVMDTRGRVIMQSDAMDKGAGRHEWNINTSKLAAGTYYYILQAGSSTLGGKFMHAE